MQNKYFFDIFKIHQAQRNKGRGMTDKERAKSLLSGDVTAVLIRGREEIISRDKGIKFLFTLASEGKTYEGGSIADKIIGKAAAYLLVMLCIKNVYAPIMTNEAAEIFEKHKINYSYIKLTDVIIGRDGKKPCIMEQAVKSAKTPVEAYNRIKQVFSEISTVF